MFLLQDNHQHHHHHQQQQQQQQWSDQAENHKTKTIKLGTKLKQDDTSMPKRRCGRLWHRSSDYTRDLGLILTLWRQWPWPLNLQNIFSSSVPSTTSSTKVLWNSVHQFIRYCAHRTNARTEGHTHGQPENMPPTYLSAGIGITRKYRYQCWQYHWKVGPPNASSSANNYETLSGVNFGGHTV